MEKRELLYEGSSKRVFATDRDNVVILDFKDEMSDDSGTKKARIPGKGEINAGLSSFLFQYIENYHVPTHFVERNADCELVVRRLEMIPIEVVVHNVASSRLAHRFQIDEGQYLEAPIIEYYLKAPKMGSPMINETHAAALGYAKPDDVRSMARMASKANAILKSLFERRGLLLVEFKLEFGATADHICIGDEVSLDTTRIWDKKKNRKLDREKVFQDVTAAEKLYHELFDRLTCVV